MSRNGSCWSDNRALALEEDMKNTSLKLQGPWEVCRRFVFPSMSTLEDVVQIRRALAELPGVRGMDFDPGRHVVKVRYETTETDYLTIEQAAEQAGFTLVDSWLARKKKDWFQSMDLTSRENAGVGSSACCNKPPARPR